MRTPVKEIGGFVLAVDPKKIDKHVVLTGSNFLVDVDGLRSGFGTDSMYRHWHKNEFVKSVTLGTQTFYLVHSASDDVVCRLYKLDWVNRQPVFLFEIPQVHASVSRKQFPWSVAFVGGLYYLSSLAFGILEYEPVANTWQNVSATIHAALGTDVIYAITQSAGRAVYLTNSVVRWSAIDDAADLTLSTATGAGAQSLALVGVPTQDYEFKGLVQVADGFMTILSTGIMKSTIIDSINPFRHDPLSVQHIPFNQNCIARLAMSSYVFFTPTGFYLTDGRKFQEWQPLFNEYLKSKEVPSLSLNAIGQVQLHYDHGKQLLLLSFSSTRNVNYFTNAVVLYLPRNEWGSFDYTHRAFVTIDELGDASKTSLGYVTADGVVKLFAGTTSNLQLEPDDASVVNSVENEVVYLEPQLQADIVTVNGIVISSCCSKLHGLSSVHNSLQLQTVTDYAPAFYELQKELAVYSWQTDEAIGLDPAAAILPISVSSARTPTDFTDPLWETSTVIVGTPQTVIEASGVVLGYAERVFDLSGNSIQVTLLYNNLAIAPSFYPCFSLVLSGGAIAETYQFVINLQTGAVDCRELGTPAQITVVAEGANWFVTILIDPVDVTHTLATFRVYPAATTSLTGPFTATASGSGSMQVFDFIEIGTVLPQLLISSTISQMCQSDTVVYGFGRQELVQTSLDATIEVGLHRLQSQAQYDELTELTEFALSMEASTGLGLDNEDYMQDTDTVVEDWLTAPDSFEDWGYAVLPDSEYTHLVKGTLDGFTVYQEQESAFEEIKQSGKSKFFAGGCLGLYLSLKIMATEVGHSFYLKDLEYNSHLAGRL